MNISILNGNRWIEFTWGFPCHYVFEIAFIHKQQVLDKYICYAINASVYGHCILLICLTKAGYVFLLCIFANVGCLFMFFRFFFMFFHVFFLFFSILQCILLFYLTKAFCAVTCVAANVGYHKNVYNVNHCVKHVNHQKV